MSALALLPVGQCSCIGEAELAAHVEEVLGVCTPSRTGCCRQRCLAVAVAAHVSVQLPLRRAAAANVCSGHCSCTRRLTHSLNGVLMPLEFTALGREAWLSKAVPAGEAVPLPLAEAALSLCLRELLDQFRPSFGHVEWAPSLQNTSGRRPSTRLFFGRPA